MEKRSKILEEMCKNRNEYDWCVMNKIVKDKQCTNICHVDVLNMLHIHPSIVSSVLDVIDAEYVNIAT